MRMPDQTVHDADSLAERPKAGRLHTVRDEAEGRMVRMIVLPSNVLIFF